MKLQLCASNALNKHFKADLPRLLAELGKPAGVNTTKSDDATMCWQVHIIENRYNSLEKTIIVCEANSRFTFFIPVMYTLSMEALTATLQQEWQAMLAATLEVYQLIPRSDIAVLLSELSQIEFTPYWVKNTDLSINGHIIDAGLWVTETLDELGLSVLSQQQAEELVLYLNTQPKRITNKTTGRKEKFVPVDR